MSARQIGTGSHATPGVGPDTMPVVYWSWTVPGGGPAFRR